MTTNEQSTRYSSQTQEARIAKKFNGQISLNSGAAKFASGDVIIPDIAMLIECKTCMKPQKSFSIKEEWLSKSKQEMFASRMNNRVIALNFYFKDNTDYYVIDDKLMGFLIEKLREENS